MTVTQASVAASRALDDLYRTHVSEVYRYAYAVLGNHADAEDVTQTTFVNALRALERGERPRKPSNWLITITHNIVRQRFRQQQARPAEVALDHDVAQEPHESTGPSLEELVRALQRIPQSQREALVMRELEGRSYSEISQILGLSTGALETLLFRARRSLAEELENVVTCDRAERGLSRQLDGRLTRKERKRLDDHIAECPSCSRLQATQGKQRRAFKSLALLPLPLSLTLFKGAPSASAAVGLPTIGAAGTAAVVGGTAATGGGGLTLGGLALGGVAVKAAAVAAAVSVASGVGYVGTKEIQSHRSPATTKPPPTLVSHPKPKPTPRPSIAGRAHKAAVPGARRKALAAGSARATAPTGSIRGATAPGRTSTPPGLAPPRGSGTPRATANPRSHTGEAGHRGTPTARAAKPEVKTKPLRARDAVAKPRPAPKPAAKPKRARHVKSRSAAAPGKRVPVTPARAVERNGRAAALADPLGPSPGTHKQP